MDDFKIKFHGVRGSYPVTDAFAAFFGGDTACVSVVAGGEQFIFDAGTGIIACGRDLPSEGQGINLCFSHFHFDHYSGLPFFAPLFNEKFSLRLYGPDLVDGSFEKILKSAVNSPFFPIALDDTPSSKEFVGIDCVETGREYRYEISPDVVLRVLSCQHPQDGVLVYRIDSKGKSFVYATDVELEAQAELGALRTFCAGVDCLLLDSQYVETAYKEQGYSGWGHSTVEMAAVFAGDCGVESLVLFHHDPFDKTQDIESKVQIASQFFSGRVVAAKQGFEIDL